MKIERAREYQEPFKYIENIVKPYRLNKPNEKLHETWWLFWCPRPEMREALIDLDRYIATPISSTHRVFIWVEANVITENTSVVIARDDDYFFGVLHSLIHEIWSLRAGNWLGQGDDARYTPTKTFQQYPFPWPPGEEPADSPLVQAIATAAHNLNTWREAWLNPPPPDPKAIDVTHEKMLKNRTLTNLYNGLVYYREHPGPAFVEADFGKETRGSVPRSEIETLHDLHTILDTAVCDAYGWPHTILQDEEQIRTNLLALNQARAGG